jgi:hypothetical protein
VRSKRHLITLIIILSSHEFAATAVHAQVFSSITTGKPTWTRPVPNGSALSAVTVSFYAVPFYVSTSGNSSLNAGSHGTFDLVEFLYDSSFNANTPLAGFLTGANTAGFGAEENLNSIPFTANTLYYAVTTGFNPSDNGPFVLTFSGPSSVTVVFPPQLAGDFDRNGSVNGDDYAKWTSTFGSTVTFLSGADGNGNGQIDAADYTVWRDHFIPPAGGAAASVAVPEPSSNNYVIVAAVLLGLVARNSWSAAPCWRVDCN